MEELSRTALFQEHLHAGARMVPFAGWEMPVQYGGIRPEVLAVREACGIFDVSHMGQLDVTGPGAAEALNQLVCSDWGRVKDGGVGYSLLLNDEGGVIDDLMAYRFSAEQWLLVVNSSRAVLDEAWIRARLPDFGIRNRYEDQCMIAVQGPLAQEQMAHIVGAEIATIAFRRWRQLELVLDEGQWPAIITRGGYTGSDGFEIMGPAAMAAPLWQALRETGAVPCGLGARDVLRLEAGLPLYGHELREEWTPYESGCGRFVKLEKGPFTGKEKLVQGKGAYTIRGIQMEDKSIPREDYRVLADAAGEGVITSGTLSITLGCGIALARVPASWEAGLQVEVMIHGSARRGRIIEGAFVPHAPHPAPLLTQNQQVNLS